MPKVEAWMVQQTGELFLHKADYQRRLRELARQRAEQRRIDALVRGVDDWIAEGQKCSSFDEIIQWLVAEFPGGLAHLPALAPFGRRRGAAPFRLLKVSFERMRWSDRCSNTHAAPKGKPTNWGSKPDLPTGYPGWTGNIHLSCEGDTWRLSDMLKRVGIHTGSGGGANHSLRYGVTLFAEEWPSLAVMAHIKGEAA
jgi:hypothetical protein